MKACVEFYCRQIAEKILSKIPAVIANLEGLVQTSLLLFWSVSECRVPLFNQLIQLLAEQIALGGGPAKP